MNHSFDIGIAKEYGMAAAVLLNNIEHWSRYNEVNRKNFHEGKYWVFNSIKAFEELFPYLTWRQIQYALKKLIDGGIIITGNFNESAYDRTLWYALTDYGKAVLGENRRIEKRNNQQENQQENGSELPSEAQNSSVKSIGQICRMDDTALSNGFDSIVEPIPDINTNINNNSKTLPVASRQKVSKRAEREDKPDMTRREWEDTIRKNIGFDALTSDPDNPENEKIIELTELIVDTVSANKPTVRIAGGDMPIENVRNRLLQLNSLHILFVLERLSRNENKIRNIKQYLLAALYNAPITMANYEENRANAAAGVFTPRY